MSEHKFGLQSKYFKKIVSGEKTVECRLFDEKRRMIKLGDLIEFKNSTDNEIVKTEVIGLICEDTFSELIDQVGVDAVGGSNKEDFLAELSQFYAAKQEHDLGAIGIEVK